MFTIKYRQFEMCATQQAGGPTSWTSTEQLWGPFEFVSQEMEGENMVIHAHYSGDTSPGMMFGPYVSADNDAPHRPRPVLWVMNASGATVAKYDL